MYMHMHASTKNVTGCRVSTLVVDPHGTQEKPPIGPGSCCQNEASGHEGHGI